MSKSSIHFKPVQANSEAHNERLVPLDYNYPSLVENNESWKSEDIGTRYKRIVDRCKEVSGRKMQKNSIPIREAVVNLNANHQLSDLNRLASVLRLEKGIDCFQIHIHRDEGVSINEINYHAHMLFDWQNKDTGKMWRLNRLDLSQIQDTVAQTLSMERGELKTNTNRQRLEAIAYKYQQEKIRLTQLQNDIEILEQKKKGAVIRGKRVHQTYQRARAALRQSQIAYRAKIRHWATEGLTSVSECAGRTIEEVNRAIELQGERIEQQQTEIRKATEGIRSVQQEIESIEGTEIYRELEREISETEADIERLAEKEQQ